MLDRFGLGPQPYSVDELLNGRPADPIQIGLGQAGAAVQPIPVINQQLSALLGRTLSSVLLGLQVTPSLAAADCLSWLSSNGDDVFSANFHLRPAQFINTVNGQINQLTGASTAGNFIFVNQASAFSNAGFVTPLGYASNTAAAQAEILIHEMAHVYGLLLPDAGNAQAQAANRNRIGLNCGAFIDSLSHNQSF
jgi:hypothetical protein